MVSPLRTGYSQYHQGNDHAAGLVRINGVPAVAQVFLHDQETGRLLARTWSNPAGEFRFDYADPSRKYYALAFDPVTGEKAEVFDRI
ncbi:hypothetical protein [Solimonas sp. K1W22B-7]|uniref:hypothetical protein n=1 Tax=Solimonas sp. K1W22B-7 TaxID=2303331 RepID=UPI0013C48BE5|nr:hypothetical protein [Solimonas sp. K1W22B-7]